MSKIQKHIEIVRSTVLELSSLSQESCDAIYQVLAQNYEEVGISVVNNLNDLALLLQKQPDLVFLGIKFIPAHETSDIYHSKKVWISEFLADHHIEHTGSPHSAVELEFMKPLAKQRIIEAGLQTSPYIVIPSQSTYPFADFPLHFPAFVKPSCLGGGQGIDASSVVHSIAQLENKVNSLITEFATDVQVEEYVSGREFSVAVLEDERDGKLICMPIELVAPLDTRGDRILSQEVKTANAEVVLPVTDLHTRAAVIEAASDMFSALGARNYGRIDMRLDDAGVPQFLEANLIPSLIDGYGSFPKACALNINMDYESMILYIVRLGFAKTEDVSGVTPEDLLNSYQGSSRITALN